MATLESLKRALRQNAAMASSLKQPLSDIQYSTGFETLVQGAGWMIYQDFIIPQLNQVLAPLFNSRLNISVLEVGPGPKSLLAYLPAHLRRRVRKYTAFEPNRLFVTRLEEWLCYSSEKESPLPCLEGPPDLRRTPFVPQDEIESIGNTITSDYAGKYDLVLFCHSMYGMKPKHKFIKQALEMLIEQPQSGILAVFHRDGDLHLDGLVCHQTASFPNGIIRIANEDEVLDCFARFIAGFVPSNVDAGNTVLVDWRKVCRTLGQHEKGQSGHLSFSSPNVMMTFSRHATRLPELTAEVPMATGNTPVKNREARFHRPASVLRPTDIRHLQLCVRWALKYGTGLTIIGGGHSGHCLRSNVVSIDMGSFEQVQIITVVKDGAASGSGSDSLVVVAEAGCKTGDIIRKTMAAGVTVPLGARPSVGAGLWLQGGIGHLARLHGLACDAVIGAIVVSVESSEVLCIGCVPTEHQPAGAVRPENESDLLWAIKGAGTSFGIVVSVIFKAYPAPTYLIRNWVFPVSGNLDASLRLRKFDNLVTKELHRNVSADAYLYRDAGQLLLGVSMFESCTTKLGFQPALPTPISAAWGLEDDSKIADGVEIFETEMYMSRMHSGHCGSKTSSFKRCLFFDSIGAANVADRLVLAVETSPSPLCYLHLLQGGGAVSDITADATAFGCRDWAFACVITGVWPRAQDGTEVARSVVQWVYNLSTELLSLSSGAYGADLGPDPRDALLAARAFGPNRRRLAHLKRSLDPHNILPYACPLPKPAMEQKLVILVSGESGAGKDYCAGVWVSEFTEWPHKRSTARVVSISDTIKREYAAATGTDLNRLLWDRAYKEQHRSALTAFFQEQVQRQPRLPEQHFLNVVNANDVDILVITGMRDQSPIAVLSHLVPDRRLIEVRVQTSEKTRRIRRGYDSEDGSVYENTDGSDSRSDFTSSNYRPSLIFENETTGDQMARAFAQNNLLPFLNEDLQRLANMVRRVADFPRPGIEFCHVLGIPQQPDGLELCTSLLKTHFAGDWAKVEAVVCCEAGGFVYASALALRVNVPLVLIREAGKLPPPTLSAIKTPSHISSLASNTSKDVHIEMERHVLGRGASVVVVDDVFSTGETLCAVLQLLNEAGIDADNVGVMVVVEFPVHRGRELLRHRGFGAINVQSLLIHDGA